MNRVLANALSGNNIEEKLEKASNLQIEDTERVGKYNPNKGRPIAVNFIRKSDAETILRNKKKLAKGVFVDRYYSLETEHERKRLRPILTAARRLEEYRGKCKMDGTDLIIKGKRYNMNNLSELPQNLNLQAVSCRQNADYYGFFGEFNPLSNFHPAKFTHEGVEYSNSEQFIQATKARFCEDKQSLNQILITESPYKCKDLGRNVKNCNITDWNANAQTLCFPGLLSKFEQNPGLAAFLKSTGRKTLLECCWDEVWGNGKPLSDPECIDRTKFTNQGILGTMLEEIRSILLSKPTFIGHTVHSVENESTSTCVNMEVPNHF